MTLPEPLSEPAQAVYDVLLATARRDADGRLVSGQTLYRFLEERFGLQDPASRRVRTRAVRELTEQGLVLRDNVRGRTVELLPVGDATPAGTDPTFDDYVAAIDTDLDVATETTRRIEQGFLRRVLLRRQDEAPCAFCGQLLPADLLVAAHLTRRAELTKTEKLNFPAIAAAVGNLARADVAGRLAPRRHGERRRRHCRPAGPACSGDGPACRPTTGHTRHGLRVRLHPGGQRVADHRPGGAVPAVVGDRRTVRADGPGPHRGGAAGQQDRAGHRPRAAQQAAGGDAVWLVELYAAHPPGQGHGGRLVDQLIACVPDDVRLMTAAATPNLAAHYRSRYGFESWDLTRALLLERARPAHRRRARWST